MDEEKRPSLLPSWSIYFDFRHVVPYETTRNRFSEHQHFGRDGHYWVSTTVTVFVGTEETIRNRFPEENNVSFVTDLGTTGETLAASAQNVMSQVTERTEEAGLEIVDGTSYRYASFMGELEDNRLVPADASQGMTIPMMMVLFPLEDYNRVTGESLALAEDELMLKAAGMEFEQEYLEIVGETFKVHPIEELPYFMDANAYLTETMIVVAPNTEAIDRLVANFNAGDQSSKVYWSAICTGPRMQRKRTKKPMPKSSMMSSTTTHGTWASSMNRARPTAKNGTASTADFYSWGFSSVVY